MQAAELFMAQFQFIQRFFNNALEGMTAEELCWRPAAEANSAGFLFWHLLRTWDSYLSLVDGQEEVYRKGGWERRFGFETSGRGIAEVGTGFTAEDVDIVRPSADLLAGYLEALVERTNHYLVGASAEALDRAVTVPWWPKPSTAAGVTAHIVQHSIIHLGGAEYVKGMKMESGT